jgi:hypothetical protein
MFQTKFVEKIRTHISYLKFFPKIVPFLDTVEKYDTARRDTDDIIIRRLRFACWVTKAINTNSEYVILTALPRKQCLRERASMLRNTYIICIISELDCVYCAVRNESLYKIQVYLCRWLNCQTACSIFTGWGRPILTPWWETPRLNTLSIMTIKAHWLLRCDDVYYSGSTNLFSSLSYLVLSQTPTWSNRISRLPIELGWR